MGQNQHYFLPSLIIRNVGKAVNVKDFGKAFKFRPGPTR